MRRGLTLLEVVVALALLASLTLLLLPVLRESTHTRPPDSAVLEQADLEEFCQRFLEEPEAFGHEQVPDSTRLAWPEFPDRPAVEMTILQCQDPSAHHAWISFRCQDLLTFHYRELPDDAAREPREE